MLHLDMDPALEVAVALRVVAMALFLSGAGILARAWLQSSLQKALAVSVLRRERRLSLVTALLILFCCLGLALGLSAYQDLHGAPFDLAQLVGGVLLLAASVSTFGLTWFGFGVLPTSEEATLIADAPEPYVAAVGIVDRESDR